MSEPKLFSTSPDCRNGYEIEVIDGSVSLVRRFWSEGANQREYRPDPKKGEGTLTREITETAMAAIITTGSPDTVKELYSLLERKGKVSMKRAQKKVVKNYKYLF